MEWPPQDTGRFAVPFCVQCCTFEPVDKYEISGSANTGYMMVGTPNPDGSGTSLFRTVTWSGGFSIQYSNEEDCSIVELTSTASYSGASTNGFDMSISGSVVLYQDSALIAETNIDAPSLVAPNGMPDDTAGGTTGSTEYLDGTGECYVVSGGSIYPLGRATGQAVATFSNICTEEDSIAWYDAEYPGWDSWSNAFMDSLWDYVWTSGYQPAPPATVGWYRHGRMRFRRTKSGYTPGARYICQMQVERTAYGEGAWALYATIETTLDADASGTLTWEGETPFARGYETWVKARSFTAVPA